MHRNAVFSCQVSVTQTTSYVIFIISNSLFQGISVEIMFSHFLSSKQELLVNKELLSHLACKHVGI